MAAATTRRSATRLLKGSHTTRRQRRRRSLIAALVVVVLVGTAAVVTGLLVPLPGGTTDVSAKTAAAPRTTATTSTPQKASPSASAASASPSPSTTPTPAVFPLPGNFRKAQLWIAKRTGFLGLAVIDSSGHLYGWHAGRMFISGSVTKAMLMVQYLRTHATITSDMREVLTSMIEVSDNDAADIVYAATGCDYGLSHVAHRAHMRHFVANRGFWGNSFINAADQARFFFSMDKLIPKRHLAFARLMLSHIVSWESYGIPAVARPYWRVYFKGGWRSGLHGNRLIHQVARLEHGKTVFAVAIMTDGDPTDAYGRATLQGVTKRLLGK